MGHVLVLEGAHHVQKGVVLGDGVHQRPAQPALPADADAQPGDVVVFDLRPGRLARLEHGAQPVDARIGHSHRGGVGLDAAGRVGGRLHLAAGQGVEYGRFGAIWQTDNADLHVMPPA